jgi:hypothetical protein
MLAPRDGDTNSVEQQEQQRQVLVDRSQKNVETPGDHEEEKPGDQRDDKTQAERPLVRQDRLVDLLRHAQPDLPQHGRQNGSQDVCDVEAARDPGCPVRRQLIGDDRHPGCSFSDAQFTLLRHLADVTRPLGQEPRQERH